MSLTPIIIYLNILIEEMEIRDAMAAPVIPYIGIKIRLVIIVVTASRGIRKTFHLYNFEFVIISWFNPIAISNNFDRPINNTTYFPFTNNSELGIRENIASTFDQIRVKNMLPIISKLIDVLL